MYVLYNSLTNSNFYLVIPEETNEQKEENNISLEIKDDDVVNIPRFFKKKE